MPSKDKLLKICHELKIDVDKYCEEYFKKPFKRKHLGASKIGEECSRQLWYDFRKVKIPTIEGRMQRLFNRGHEEEERIIKWLTGIGATVTNEDPETKKQYRFSDCDDHFGGSCDGFIWLPEKFGFAEWLLLELKTSNAKRFKQLLKNGVIRELPVYYAQMSMYGYKFNLRYGLYVSCLKDNDDLYYEILPLDHELGKELIGKANDIIHTQQPPMKFSQDPSHFTCKWCNHASVCHYGAPIDKHCLSCEYAVPSLDGTWTCLNFGDIIPKDFIPKGCGDWKAIV